MFEHLLSDQKPEKTLKESREGQAEKLKLICLSFVADLISKIDGKYLEAIKEPITVDWHTYSHREIGGNRAYYIGTNLKINFPEYEIDSQKIKWISKICFKCFEIQDPKVENIIFRQETSGWHSNEYQKLETFDIQEIEQRILSLLTRIKKENQ